MTASAATTDQPTDQPPQRITAPFLDVLAYLIEHPTGAHGFAIWNDTNNSSGTVYAVLRRLVSAEWAAGHWENGSPASPARQIITLTEHGATQARALLHKRRPALVPRQTRVA